MPQGVAYVDDEYYRSYFKLQNEGSDHNSLINTLCAQASRTLDKRCRRQFGRLEGTTRRRYRSTGQRTKLYVDDISTTDGVLVQYRYGGGLRWYTLDADSYELGPEDATEGWMEPQPFTYIELFPANSQLTVWPDQSGYRNYPPEMRVTARWGWPEVPDTIKTATAEIVGIYTLENPRVKVETNSIGIPIVLPREARTFIDQLIGEYRKVIF